MLTDARAVSDRREQRPSGVLHRPFALLVCSGKPQAAIFSGSEEMRRTVVAGLPQFALNARHTTCAYRRASRCSISARVRPAAVTPARCDDSRALLLGTHQAQRGIGLA